MLSRIISPNNISSKKIRFSTLKKNNLLSYNRRNKNLISKTPKNKSKIIIENIEDEKCSKNDSKIFFSHQNQNKKNSISSNYNNLSKKTRPKNSIDYCNKNSSFTFSKNCSSNTVSNDLLNINNNNYITNMVNNEQKKINNINNNDFQIKKNDEEIDDMIKFLKLYNFSYIKDNNNFYNSPKFSNRTSRTADSFNTEKKIYKKNTVKKFNIEGTNILSPFCPYARDKYLYQNIFRPFKQKNLNSDFYIDNKLNIIYAENQEKYKQNLIKLNNNFKKIGKKMHYNIEPSLSETKLRFIKNKIGFIKKIVDYVYPNLASPKIQHHDKNNINYNNNFKSDIITCKINKNINKSNLRIFGKNLLKSLSVQRFHIKEKNCDSQIY